MDLLTIPEQIAKIQSQLSMSAPQYTPQERMPVTIAELEVVIKRVFNAQVAEMSKGQVAEQVSVGSAGNDFIVAVGSALNEDQQVWLSNPANQDKIIDFLTSPNGQALTRRFFTTYKDYKETK
jgi:hypothetical protein